MKKDKIKLKDRPSIKWIKDKAPDILGGALEFAGELTGVEFLEKLGEKIQGKEDLSAEDKAHILEVIRLEVEAEKEISKRWDSDMSSDNKLSKNVRPIVLLYSWALITLIVVLSFFKVNIPTTYVYLIEALCVSVNVAYFGSRGLEKYSDIKNKKR